VFCCCVDVVRYECRYLEDIVRYPGRREGYAMCGHFLRKFGYMIVP
jgi:hypothetical protein